MGSEIRSKMWLWQDVGVCSVGTVGQAFIGDAPTWQTEQRFWEIFGCFASKITSLNQAHGMEEEAMIGCGLT